MQTAGGGWMAQHLETGDAAVDVQPDGTTAVMVWRGLARLKRCIDAAYRAPGDEAAP